MADCYPSQASFGASHSIRQNQPCIQQPSAFRDLMCAFPRPRHTGRVTKPRSAGNSPSSAGRRRTTTMFHSSPTNQLLPNQGYHACLNAALLASAIQSSRRSRPISWHPVSMETTEYLTPQYYPPFTNSNDFATMLPCSQSLQTAPNAGDGNMLHPFPQTELPNSHHSFSLNGLPDQLPPQESSFVRGSGQRLDAVSWDDPPSGLPALSHPVSDNWPFDMMAMNQSIPSIGVADSTYESVSVSSPGHWSEPATPDFLPIQHSGDPSNPQPTFGDRNTEDELVGMGLYNHPESFLESSFGRLSGKGLKLEETFTPSSDNEADDNDAERDDQPEEKDNRTNNRHELQPSNHESYAQATKSAGSMLQKSFFFEDTLDQRTALEPRQSLSVGGTTCMSYGYGWI